MGVSGVSGSVLAPGSSESHAEKATAHAAIIIAAIPNLSFIALGFLLFNNQSRTKTIKRCSVYHGKEHYSVANLIMVLNVSLIVSSDSVSMNMVSALYLLYENSV